MTDPDNAPSLSELLFDRWRARPAEVFLTLDLDDGPRPLTGERLLALAGSFAAGLAARGVGPGDRVGLVLSTSEAFIGAFFGAWWLGASAIPLSPPRGAEDSELLRIGRALVIGEARLAVVPDETPDLPFETPVPLVRASLIPLEPALAAPPAHSSLPAIPGLRDISPSLGKSCAPGHSSFLEIAPRARPDLAVIQFSSGSTGHPKGVALTDAALQANLRAISAVLGPGPADVGVAWLPLHHDMGLIGVLLIPLHAGFPTWLIPPERFIRQPARWIQLLGEHGATVTTSPNFGYALAARLPAAATPGLDLSRLRAALVGAEPVRAASLEAFAARYAAHGFQATAFVPTYGLAEATLAVAMPPPGRGPRSERVARGPLEAEHRAELASADAPEASVRELMGLGGPVPGVALTIRDDQGQELPARQVGEVWVRTPALMVGYWNDPEASERALRPGGWLATGDLGYLADGELFIAGRLKDLIIRAGRKYHPADLEAVAEADPAVRPGGTAAFAVEAAGDRPERVVLLVEPRQDAPLAALAMRVRQRVLEATGLRLDEVVLVAPRTLPKTTSGKIQRGEARRRWRAGSLGLAGA